MTVIDCMICCRSCEQKAPGNACRGLLDASGRGIVGILLSVLHAADKAEKAARGIEYYEGMADVSTLTRKW